MVALPLLLLLLLPPRLARRPALAFAATYPIPLIAVYLPEHLVVVASGSRHLCRCLPDSRARPRVAIAIPGISGIATPAPLC